MTTYKYLFLYFIIHLSFISQSQTISINPLSPDSDYFGKVDWVINPSTICGCAYNNDIINIHQNDLNGWVYYTNSRATSGTQWSGQASIGLHPGASEQIRAAFIDEDYSFANGSCTIPCNPNNTTSFHILQTEPLRKATNVFATSNNAGQITVNFTTVTDIPETSFSVHVFIDGIEIGVNYNKSTTSITSTNHNFATGVNHNIEVRTYYNRFATGQQSASTFINYIPPLPDGQISGNISTSTGAPVQGVTVTATLTNPQDLSFGYSQVLVHQVSTNSNGDYLIPNLYYGLNAEVANYQIVPSLTGHTYTPAQGNLFLSSANHVQSQNFTDNTNYVINGVVRSDFGCGLEGVIISAPGASPPIPSTITAADGSYTMVAAAPDSYTIIASLPSEPGSIPDSVMNVDLVNNLVVNNIDFNYTPTKTVSGFIGAGCQEFIGIAEIDFKAPNGCIIASLQTNNSGYYSAVLPKRNIKAKVINFIPDPGSDLNPLDVLAQIEQEIQIDKNVSERDFIYRKPIQIEINGMPSPNCMAIPFPILEQGNTYPLQINVWEALNVCRADTGILLIQSNISGGGNQAEILDSVPISQGIATYLLKPGEPNLIAPHVKYLTLTAKVDSQSVSSTLSAIVTGARQQGDNFITGAPVKIPYLILRDPPGDKSYSFFSQGNTTKISQTISTNFSESLNIWAKAKTGADIFGLEISASIGGNIQLSFEQASSEENTFSLTSMSQFQTSSSSSNIGDDIFIGAAVNFKYAKADIIDFDLNACEIVRDTVLMMSPDSISTAFDFSESDIRNTVIPNLRDVASNSNTHDTLRLTLLREIDMWEQTLQFNDDLKAAALLGNVQNRSIGGGAGAATFSSSSTISEIRTFKFTTQIDVGVAADLGIEFNNNGFEAGVDVNFQTTIGQSESQSNSTTTTTGYTLDDDDNGDAISFDVGLDPVYGTAVFGEPIGQTSCPHEANTARIRDMSISSPNPVQVLPAGQNIAFFTLSIGNTTEAPQSLNGTQSYLLSFNATSNEGGALVMSGANDFGDPIFIGPLNPGQMVSVPITVERPLNNEFTFEGLEFTVFPACTDGTVSRNKKSIQLSAYFNSPCSDIVMTLPEDGWLVNQTNNDDLTVVMNGYDLNTTIQSIVLQYRLSGSVGWSESNNVSAVQGDLLPGQNGTAFTWHIDQEAFYVEDGEYELRFKLNCGSSINYSGRVKGRIERTLPDVFGNEKPLDELYVLGSEISSSFTELINCSSLTSSDVYLKRKSDGMLFPITFTCSDNLIVIEPIDDIANEELFESFEVGIINVADLFGNVRPDTISWSFIVGDMDSDGDGIADMLDRCPGGNDYVDTDLNGIPDDCDCLPEIPQNDTSSLVCETCDSMQNTVMHFDGGNDKIFLNPDFNDVYQYFTYDFWINPEDTIPVGEIEDSVGVGSFVQQAIELPFAIYPEQGELTYGIQQSIAGVAVGKNGVLVISHSADHAPSILVYYGSIKGWTHIAVSFDFEIPSLYINGEKVKEGLSPLHNIHPSADIGGGMPFPGHYNFFKGQMDEFRIWDYSISTDATVKELMFSQPDTIPNGNLILHYSFEEGTPHGDNSALTEVIDQSGSGRNGLLNNISKNGYYSNWFKGPLLQFIDDDGDGIEDGCDNCTSTLTLNLMQLPMTGTFTASQKITLGAGVVLPPNADVILKAPLVEVSDGVEFKPGSLLTIDPDGCINN